MPPGYTVETGGESKAQRTAFVAFTTIFGLALLLLCGIVMRTSILLIESAGRRRREGSSAAGAIAPLAFGVGSGSEFERPLAAAVMGGIVTATALTLLVVPVLYVVTATFGEATKLSLD